MRTLKILENRSCPLCGSVENQKNAGFNKSGTQRCICKICKKYYTLEPKTRAYSEETQKLAMRIYYQGVSGRGVGKILNMSKANIYNWIKKTESGVDKSENEN